MSPARVVMLGGGYVALGLARGLRGAIGRAELELTVVSRENYHVFHGFVPQMVTGAVGADHILSPVRRAVRPARLLVGEVVAVDLAARVVRVARQPDGRGVELPYDHLVLGLGSRDNLDAYPGLAEHAFRLRTYDDCFQLRNHVIKVLELAEGEADPAERCRLLTFCVAGGGYAGAEVAAELCEYVRGLVRRDYRGIAAGEWRVVLVHPGATILPELAGTRGEQARGFPRLVAYATAHLRGLGVELMTETRVVGATAGAVALSSGARVPTRTIVSAVGSRPAALLDAMPLPRGRQGRVETDRELRVPGFPGVWAAGDCAAVPHPTGGVCPPLAIYALEQGRVAAENIRRAVAGLPPRPFRYVAFGQGVAIGRRSAVAEVRGVELRGLPAWVIGRLLLLANVPSLERRVRLVADWLLGQAFGRNLVEASVADADDYEIAHQRFQPGEVLAHEGGGGYLYLIDEGEVELVRGHGRPDEALCGVVGPGAYVGRAAEGAPPQTARARTHVRAVAVRADQAGRLRALLAALPPAE